MSSVPNLTRQLEQAGLSLSAALRLIPARVVSAPGIVTLEDDDGGDENGKLTKFLEQYCEQQVHAERLKRASHVKQLQNELKFVNENLKRRSEKLDKLKNEDRNNGKVAELEKQVAELTQNHNDSKEQTLKFKAQVKRLEEQVLEKEMVIQNLKQDKDALEAQLAIRNQLIQKLKKNPKEKRNAVEPVEVPPTQEMEFNNREDVRVDEVDESGPIPPPQDEEHVVVEPREVVVVTRSRRSRRLANALPASNSMIRKSTRGRPGACEACGKEYVYQKSLETHYTVCKARLNSGPSNGASRSRAPIRKRGGNKIKETLERRTSLRSAQKKRRTQR